jgi:hypothetical protein
MGYGFPLVTVGSLPPGHSPGRRMVRGERKSDPSCMLLPSNTSQRDLVRLAVLMCSERPSAKHRPAVKGL